jgi:hypothetical protein
MDFLLTQIMLPTLFSILQSNPENIFIHKLKDFFISYLKKSVTPIHLGKTAPEVSKIFFLI